MTDLNDLADRVEAASGAETADLLHEAWNALAQEVGALAAALRTRAQEKSNEQ